LVLKNINRRASKPAFFKNKKMENTIEFLYLRINAMQSKIEKLEMTISEINDYYLVDRNVDTKQLTK
jgi:hypothetical protein